MSRSTIQIPEAPEYEQVTTKPDSLAEVRSLAAKLVWLMVEGPGHPVALVGADGKGAAAFLKGDLAEAFSAVGWVPVFVDFGPDGTPRTDRLAAFQVAVDTAIERAVEAGRAAAALALAPRRDDPPSFVLGAALDALHQRTGSPLAILIAGLPESIVLDDAVEQVDAAAIRAVLTTRADWTRVVFSTGDALATSRVLGHPTVPMYQFATQLGFPTLEVCG